MSDESNDITDVVREAAGEDDDTDADVDRDSGAILTLDDTDCLEDGSDQEADE